MPVNTLALETLDKFANISKELAKLPALVLPQYRNSVKDLYEICQKLLIANENLSRWLFQFLYFDFRHPEAQKRFQELLEQYQIMKSGLEFQKLKISCGDINRIYYKNISSKIGNWFTSQAKIEEVEGIFQALGYADGELVALTYDHVVARIDDFIMHVEGLVKAGAMDDAERIRLKFKAELRDVAERLQKFGGELVDLVILFAEFAHEPVTLGS